MWIRDALPKALPTTRVVLFGYDTTLVESNSFQTISDLASFVIENLNASTLVSSAKPLIFLAHSLGGIVFKAALVALANGGDCERQILRRVAGAVLFGVPSRGMETQALMAMVRGQANEGIVRDLTAKSHYLQSLDDRFLQAALTGTMKLFWAFETRTSPTVVSTSSL
jgi:predicted alpha/beta hydrolase family esterase